MSIRKHPTRPGVWQIIVSQGAKGKQLVFPYECTEAEALVLDKQINAQIKGERTEVFPTITAALPQYLEYYTTIASPGIVTDCISIFRRKLLPHFGKYCAHQIIPTTVYAYTAQRLKDPVTQANGEVTGRTVSHRTIEKELNHLSALCRWLHLNGMAEKMPAIPKPPKAKTQPKTVQQPLSLDALNRLIAAVKEDKRVLLLLMSDAGLRMDEALSLKTGEIDIEGGRMTVHGKNGKVVVYPILTERLQAALSSALETAASRGKASPYLTINPKTGKPFESLKTMLKAAAIRAGINSRVTHHTLRHTFSTLLMESGVTTEVRRVLMRHSSLAATEKYTHTSPGYMRSQAGNFSDMVNGEKTPL